MTPKPTLVEKMGMEMAKALDGDWAPDTAEEWRRAARAALAVVMAEMREPSGPMIDAALLVDKRWSLNMIPRVKDAWRAMLAQFEKEST